MADEVDSGKTSLTLDAGGRVADDKLPEIVLLPGTSLDGSKD